MVNHSAISLMREFIKHAQNLYDPMIYICETELDFPFNETLLPIIKTKLLDSVNGITPYI
jgi:hypothetical protein